MSVDFMFVATERHEARRIDDQLRGRAGRQGDPGSSQFFVSAEDDVVRIFGGDRIKNLMERLGVAEDEAIENSMLSRAIEQAQSKIEGNNFDTRKYVLEYDDVMNKHRTAMYVIRNDALKSESVKELISGYLGDDPEKITEYEKREQELGAEAMRNLEKMVVLRVIDELWVDHLEQMEHLRDSVRLRAYGQRDPLVEYKIEAQKMFNELQATVQSQIVGMIFKVGVVNQPRVTGMQEGRQDLEGSKPTLAVGSPTLKGVGAAQSMMQQSDQRAQTPVTSDKIGRNDPCPCGSGKKYKKCGLINAPEHKK